jgi:holo-[acyl-carrier protein] synthase
MWDIGVDIVDISRFRKVPYSNHKRFYSDVFTVREIEYCLSSGNPAQHFAATFAGKEAVYKAVNKRLNIGLRQIAILRDRHGVPEVNFQVHRKEGNENPMGSADLPSEVRVSLSHSSSYAIAFAIVRFGGPEPQICKTRAVP